MVWTYKFTLPIYSGGRYVELNTELTNKHYIHIDTSKDSHQGILLPLYHKGHKTVYMQEMTPQRVMVDMYNNIVFVETNPMETTEFGKDVGLKEAATIMEKNTNWVWDGTAKYE